VMHFCLQAKEEPGNINSVQLSPSVQATFSNYTRVHGGSSPAFLDYFHGNSRGRLIYSKLQTEDGGRFLFKSNRNMIVQVDDHDLTELPDGFIWLTARQIARLLLRDNLIHACTRSILAALVFGEETDISIRNTGASAIGGSLGETVQWLDDQKSANHILVMRRPLKGLKEWGMDRDGSFSQEEGRFFRVIGIEVESGEREVSSWDQPILDNPGTGIIGMLTRMQRGERYFLMQAKVEPGNRGVVQMGPTVQFTPGNYIGNARIPKPFLFDEFYHNRNFPHLFESMQSEEGARFFREAHLHRILTLPEGAALEVPPDFRWVSQTDLHLFVHMGEMVNSCARSALSLLL
ncbi:MAG TPA: NDP-hexose 2,3-dehydratase family protein, partial [Geobacteraceae bacterium]|nr:NDP-hexose 2,3-dehydratase family protein [Geobacteraceae bacterium]